MNWQTWIITGNKVTVIKIFNYTSKNLYTYLIPKRASDGSIHVIIRDGKSISDTVINERIITLEVTDYMGLQTARVKKSQANSEPS